MVKRTKDAGEKVGVKLPKKIVEVIDALVESGFYLSRAHCVRECVEEVFRQKGLNKELEEEERKIVESFT